MNLPRSSVCVCVCVVSSEEEERDCSHCCSSSPPSSPCICSIAPTCAIVTPHLTRRGQIEETRRQMKGGSEGGKKGGGV